MARFNFPIGSAGKEKPQGAKPAPAESEMGGEEAAEAPEQVAQQHGPAVEVHHSHEHEMGAHHVHSIHADGHEHHSDHASAKEALAHHSKLVGEPGEPDGDEGDYEHPKEPKEDY